MKIKILGTGCRKCEKLYQETLKAVESSGVQAQVEKIEKVDEIMAFGVMMTPALVIDEQVVFSGKVPSNKDIESLIVGKAK